MSSQWDILDGEKRGARTGMGEIQPRKKRQWLSNREKGVKALRGREGMPGGSWLDLEALAIPRKVQL